MRIVLRMNYAYVKARCAFIIQVVIKAFGDLKHIFHWHPFFPRTNRGVLCKGGHAMHWCMSMLATLLTCTLLHSRLSAMPISAQLLTMRNSQKMQRKTELKREKKGGGNMGESREGQWSDGGGATEGESKWEVTKAHQERQQKCDSVGACKRTRESGGWREEWRRVREREKKWERKRGGEKEREREELSHIPAY